MPKSTTTELNLDSLPRSPTLGKKPIQSKVRNLQSISALRSISYTPIPTTTPHTTNHSLISTRPTNCKNLILPLRRNLRRPIAIRSPMQRHLALFVLLNITRIESLIKNHASFLRMESQPSSQKSMTLPKRKRTFNSSPSSPPTCPKVLHRSQTPSLPNSTSQSSLFSPKGIENNGSFRAIIKSSGDFLT
jgi:hypothetical protein